MKTVLITHGAVKVSDIDYDWVFNKAWHVSDTGYAKCRNPIGHAPLRMHRMILELVLGRALETVEAVDHINGDRLDNRRSNLRLATHRQNSTNVKPRSSCVSEFKGVGCANDGRSKKWMAYINSDSHRYYIGKFYSEVEAAWMYDQWAIELHGEFARLNFEYKELTKAGRSEPKEEQI